MFDTGGAGLNDKPQIYSHIKRTNPKANMLKEAVAAEEMIGPGMESYFGPGTTGATSSTAAETKITLWRCLVV